MMISAGSDFSLALSKDGSVWAWGRNDNGQLGDGTTTGRAAPTRIASLSNVIRVNAGQWVGAAIKQDGSLWAWGNGVSTPRQVGGLSDIVRVGMGPTGGVALKRDGSVWTFAVRASGCSGQQVAGLGGVIAIAAGQLHYLALGQDGSVWAWGSNSYGQLGDGTTSDHAQPQALSRLSGMVGISAGSMHSVALSKDGTLWAWGLNSDGQLGDGSTANRLAPVLVSGLSGVVGLSSRYGHSMARTADGRVWAWGDNALGQLGSGCASTACATPTAVPELANVSASLASGDGHTLIVNSDGSILGWGGNSYGQVGNGDTAPRQSLPAPVLSGPSSTSMFNLASASPASISAGTASCPSAFAVTKSELGILKAKTVNASVAVPCADVGKNGSIFMWAVSPEYGTFYHDPNGWFHWDGSSPMKPYVADLTLGVNSVNIATNIDLSPFAGVKIHVGYGVGLGGDLAYRNMSANQTSSEAYQIGDTSTPPPAPSGASSGTSSSTGSSSSDSSDQVGLNQAQIDAYGVLSHNIGVWYSGQPFSY